MTDRLRDKIVPVTTILVGIVLAWYAFAVALNGPFQRDLDRRAGESPGMIEFVLKTWAQPKPTLPAPHQVVQTFVKTTFMVKPWSKRSLVYHAWVTLSATFVGFLFGAVLGILIAVGDRKSTRLNSSHVKISYAVFCLKKKTINGHERC